MIINAGGDVVEVSKAVAVDFTAWRDRQFAAMTFADGLLRFPDSRWRCMYLGKGEEKAAFCVCDHTAAAGSTARSPQPCT
jgi:hypothetical protein